MDQHFFVFGASLVCLGLIAVIGYANRKAPAHSPLRGDMISSILLASLVGLYPIAFFGPMAGVWSAFKGGISAAAFGNAAIDLVSMGIALAILVIFRGLMKANAQVWTKPNNVTPLTPRPTRPQAPQGSHGRMKKAA